MSANNRQFIEALRRLSNTFGVDVPGIVFATVKSVDEEKRTCVCVPVNDRSAAEIPNVLISAIENDGQLKFPAVNSVVIICRTAKNQPFILKESDLAKYLLIAEEIIFNSDGYGGLIKIVEQTQKLNDALSQIKTAIDALASAADTGISSAGGTPGVVTAWNTAKNAIQNFNKSDYENTDVVHGPA